MPATCAVVQADGSALLQVLCKLTHLSLGTGAGVVRSAGSAAPFCLVTQVQAWCKLEPMHNGCAPQMGNSPLQRTASLGRP